MGGAKMQVYERERSEVSADSERGKEEEERGGEGEKVRAGRVGAWGRTRLEYKTKIRIPLPKSS